MLTNLRFAGGPITNPPRVSSPANRSYSIMEMNPGHVLSVLPRGERYALIDDELGRIKLVGEERKLHTAKKQAKPSIQKKTNSKWVGVSPTREREGVSKGQFLLSQFKEKSAIIKSSSGPRSQSPQLFEIKLGPIPFTTIDQPAIGNKSKGIELLSTGGAKPSSQSLLSPFRKELANRIEQTLRRADSPPRESTLPDPLPGDTSPISDNSPKVGTRRARRRARASLSHEGNGTQSKGTSSTNPVLSAQDSGGLSLRKASPVLHSVPKNIDPAVSKSPKLAEFANRLSSLTATLYKATELLPQMALRDLESVLENDWMVEDMERMVMGVISLVNGRDGEKQWRSGGGNGKL